MLYSVEYCVSGKKGVVGVFENDDVVVVRKFCVKMIKRCGRKLCWLKVRKVGVCGYWWGFWWGGVWVGENGGSKGLCGFVNDGRFGKGIENVEGLWSMWFVWDWVKDNVRCGED